MITDAFFEESDIGIDEAGDLLIDENGITNVIGIDLIIQKLLFLIYNIDDNILVGISDSDVLKQRLEDYITIGVEFHDILPPNAISIEMEDISEVEKIFHISILTDTGDTKQLPDIVFRAEGGLTPLLGIGSVDRFDRNLLNKDYVTEYIEITDNQLEIHLAYEPAGPVMLFNKDSDISITQYSGSIEITDSGLYTISDYIEISPFAVVDIDTFSIKIDDLEIDYNIYTDITDMLADNNIGITDTAKDIYFSDIHIGSTAVISFSAYNTESVLSTPDNDDTIEFKQLDRSDIYPTQGYRYAYKAYLQQPIDAGIYKLYYQRYLFTG